MMNVLLAFKSNIEQRGKVLFKSYLVLFLLWMVEMFYSVFKALVSFKCPN